MTHLRADPDSGDITAEELHRLCSLALQATRTVARLLREQHAISGKAAEGIAAAIGHALDELSTDWGIQL
jgi:hypothetical protein